MHSNADVAPVAQCMREVVRGDARDLQRRRPTLTSKAYRKGGIILGREGSGSIRGRRCRPTTFSLPVLTGAVGSAQGVDDELWCYGERLVVNCLACRGRAPRDVVQHVETGLGQTDIRKTDRQTHAGGEIENFFDNFARLDRKSVV